MVNDLTTAFRLTLESGLFWNELVHAVIAAPFCLLLWKKTKDIKLSLIPLLLAYLMDIDHLIDYWDYYGLGFSLSKFVDLKYFEIPGRAYIPFHAWEWALLLLPFSIKKGWKSRITAINLGVLAHLIWDMLTVGSFFFYSIIYRYLTGFRIFYF